MADPFDEIVEEVMKIAAEYSSFEEKEKAEMEAYRDLFKKDKKPNQKKPSQ
jgi:hypothetical protein